MIADRDAKEWRLSDWGDKRHARNSQEIILKNQKYETVQE